MIIYSQQYRQGSNCQLDGLFPICWFPQKEGGRGSIAEDAIEFFKGGYLALRSQSFMFLAYKLYSEMEKFTLYLLYIHV